MKARARRRRGEVAVIVNEEAKVDEVDEDGIVDVWMSYRGHC